MKLLFVIHSFHIGGVQKVMINLARAFHDAGYRVAIVPLNDEGPLRDEASDLEITPLPNGSSKAKRLTTLAANPSAWPWASQKRIRKGLGYAAALAAIIEREATLIISAEMLENCAATEAVRILGRADVKTLMCLSGHIIRNSHAQLPSANWPTSYVRRCFTQADGIVAVSHGLGAEARTLLYNAKTVHTIHNPVITPRLRRLAMKPAHHPWAQDKREPLIISVGRFSDEKDFMSLVNAFAQVRKKRRSRLLLLGYNPDSQGQLHYRDALRKRAESLGVSDSVALEPATDNPYPLMNAADVYALSSPAEGFGNVLVEALYCGLPIVSTDCPSGPREILADGRYGRLTRVGDVDAMAEGIVAALDTEPDRPSLQRRAEEFTIENVFSQYRDVVEEIAENKKGAAAR